MNRLAAMQVLGGLTASPQTFATFDYVLGRTPKRKGVTEFITGAVNRTVNYTYDRLDRLTVEDIVGEGSSGTITYDDTPGHQAGTGYDKVGNRQSRTVAGNFTAPGLTTFTGQGFDANDQFAGVAYDANGNTLDENIPTAVVSPSAAHHDEYDFENRLIRRSDGTTTIDLVYDGDGNRIRKIVTQGAQVITTTYLVDDVNPTGYSQVLAERTAIGFNSTWTFCTWGHDLITATIAGATPATHWYGYDGHGSVRFLASLDGQLITDTYTYDAFGILIAQTHLFGPTPNIMATPANTSTVT